MADFWEQDAVAPTNPPAGGDFWANDPVASAGGAPAPVPPSDAFAARVAQGSVMGQAFEEMAAKPYSQRIKEWSAGALKEGGVAGYGEAALGTLAATVASIPEMVASGVTLGKDVLSGKVITGPGLRKEDFSDDPDGPDPLETLDKTASTSGKDAQMLSRPMARGTRDQHGDRQGLRQHDAPQPVGMVAHRRRHRQALHAGAAQAHVDAADEESVARQLGESTRAPGPRDA
jgi:hypothetical protein